MSIPWLSADVAAFPPVEHALAEPDGLLAAGGDLAVPRLLAAYRRGIFPWYSQGQPILWWSPSQRAVFETARMHVPRRLRRELAQCRWTLRADTCFPAVMAACAAPRAGQDGTWITPAMLAAYTRLHQQGLAHSLEVFDGEYLVGGIYGVAVGRMFFGESMFSRAGNGSKVALLALARVLRQWDFPLLDAQVASPHLATLGAFALPRQDFCARVADLVALPGVVGNWRDRIDPISAADLVT